MHSESKLYYNHELMRWCIDARQLQPGDLLDVYYNGKWETVRIEYDTSAKKYYAIPYIPIRENLIARYKWA